MAPKSWADELPADAREVLDAGLGVDAPPGAEQTVWAGLAAKLPAAATVTATGGGLKALTLLKTFGVGLALGAATVSGVAVVRHSDAPTAPGPARALPSALPAVLARASAERTPPIRSSPVAPSAAPARSASPAPPATSASAANVVAGLAPPASPAQSVAAFPTEPAAPASVAAESAVLRESRRVAHARSLLQSGNAAGALAELDELARAFPRGVLEQEREALHIEALLATHDLGRARQEARRFLERYPRSPHAAAAERALR